MDWKRLITGLALLTLLTGVLLVCFTTGGLLNRFRGFQSIDDLTGHGIYLGFPGPVIGFVLMGIGAVGLVVVFSIKKPPRFPHDDSFDAFTIKKPSIPSREDKIEPHG